MLSKMNGQSCFQRFPAAGRCSRRFHSTYHHRKTRHRSKSIAGISTPDSFLASASQGLSLESEEIDKERSLLACPNRTPTLKSHHRHNHSKPSSGDDDLRDSYMSTDRSASFQRNFRASLFGLEDEVSVAPKQCSSGERLFLGGNGGGDHFKDLQREGSSYVIDALWTSPSRNIMRRLLSTETSLSCF